MRINITASRYFEYATIEGHTASALTLYGLVIGIACSLNAIFNISLIRIENERTNEQLN